MNKLYGIMNGYFSRFLVLVPQSVTDKVGVDKVGHFFAGLHISVFALISFFLFSTSILWIVTAPAIVGVLKEILDYILNRIEISKGLTPTHGVELLDLLATASGCIPVIFLIELCFIVNIAYLFFI